jgi:hypothetical protein
MFRFINQVRQIMNLIEMNKMMMIMKVSMKLIHQRELNSVFLLKLFEYVNLVYQVIIIDQE